MGMELVSTPAGKAPAPGLFHPDSLGSGSEWTLGPAGLTRPCVPFGEREEPLQGSGFKWNIGTFVLTRQWRGWSRGHIQA